MKNQFLTILLIIFISIGSFFTYQAFDKKDNYYNSDYSRLNVNAYVGGDAYNYIINANYFTGYIVLGCTMYLLSGMSGCLLMLNTNKNKEITTVANITNEEEEITVS